ncbi:MAG: hypothetical protein IPI44_09040 [Sulfuritalea sp.]|nr:hypothetical protein [Sulfuritalea sp.]
MGARLTYSLPRFGQITQNVSLALDDRYFDNNSALTGGPAFGTPIRTRPLSLRYAARYEQAWGGVAARVEQATNLSGGSYNNDETYPDRGLTRAGTLSATGSTPAMRWAPWGFQRGCMASTATICCIRASSLALGGVASIRGLRDREISGERGYTMTLEAQGPQLVESLRPVLFFDAGSVRRHWPTTGLVPGTTHPASASARAGTGNATSMFRPTWPMW